MSEQDTQRASTPLVTDDLQERIAKARQSAQEWRERLGVTGVATLEDTARLVAAAVPQAEIDRSEIAQPWTIHLAPGKPLLLIPANLDPEKEARALAWLVGEVLHCWGRGERHFATFPEGPEREAAKAAYDASRRVARIFAEVWQEGPKQVYRADDPRALELLAPLGLDHFPTLGEARQLAAERPEEVSVEVQPLDATWVISMLGELVFCYPEE